MAVHLGDNLGGVPGAARDFPVWFPAHDAILATRRVGMLLHPMRDPVSTLRTVSRWVARYDIHVVAAGSELHRLPPGIAPVELEQLLDRVDLLLAAGGDGTALRAIHLAAAHDVPVLAINLGRLGYLADVDPSGLDAALEALAGGRYTMDTWRALELRGGSREPTLGFHDVVLRRTTAARPVAVAVGIEGELLARYSGDGLILATAQGSTAYSFAAGGPIVSPVLAATVLTPLAPHATFNRPLVLSAGEAVEIEVLPSSSRLSIEADGQQGGEAGPGDRLRIGASARSARRVRVGRVGFAAQARSKLRIVDAGELNA